MAQFNCKVVLCDIEGTTTSISFVKDTLFPYAAKNVESYLNENWEQEVTKNVVKDLVALSKKDVSEKVEGAEVIEKVDEQAELVASIVKNVEWQMSLDRKTTELKALQGLIWKKAYEEGSIKGHVYEDVAKNFESWIASGMKIYIYSSGSVDAQKLLFQHSEAGDLLKQISGHFDTKIGAKQEADSYKSILKELELQGEDVLFLTDIAKEAEASKAAGMQTVLLDRLGSADFDEATEKSFKVVKSFDDLTLSSSSLKRKIEDKDDDQSAPAKVAKADTPQEPAAKIEEVPVIPDSKPEEKTIADEIILAEVAPVAVIEEKKVETVQEPEPMEVDSAIVEPAIEAEKMAVEEVPEKVPEKIEEPVIAAPEKIEEPVVVPEVSNVIPDAPVEPIVEPVIEPVIAEIEKETEMPKEPETTQTEPIAEKVETAPMIPEVITEDKVEDSPKDLSVAAPKMDSAPVIEKIDEIVPEKVEEPTKAVEEPVAEVLKPEEPKVDVESTTPEVVEPLIEPAVTIEKVEETKEKAIETNGTNGTKAEEKTTVNGNEEKETPEQKTNGSSEHKAQKEASENGSANGDSHTNGKEDIIDANEPVAASKDIEEPVVTPADLKAKLAEAQPPSVPVASES